MSLKKLRWELDNLTIIQIVIALSILIFFLIIPIATVISSAFFFNGKLSTEWFTQIFTNSRYFRFPPEGELYTYSKESLYIQGINFGIILNSLIIAAFVSLFATLIGTLLAILMARYNFRGKTILRILILIPMLSTPFVNAFVIKQWLTSDYSLLNQLLHDILHLIPYRISMDGLAAITLVQILSLYPIVYLNAHASIINIDPSLEESAENLGAHGIRQLFTITLPLAKPGIAAGAILVYIFSLEDLGAPIVFHSNALAKQIMSYQIYSQFYSAIAGGLMPETMALSVVMLAIALVGFVIIKKYVSMRTYAMLNKGGRWSPRIRKLGIRSSLVVYPLLAIFIVIASLSQIGVLIYSFAKTLGDILPATYSLENYERIFSEPAVSTAILNSLKYSLAAVGVIVLVALSSAYIVGRKKIPGKGIIDMLVTMPIAVPGLVISIGYLYFFSNGIFSNSILDPFFSAGFLIAVAYSIRRLPFAARSIYAGIQQVNVNLEEASLNVGAGRIQTYRRILLPLIAVNVISGAMLSFVYCMSEVSVSTTLGGLSEGSYPMTFYMKDVILRAAGAIPLAATLGVILMLSQIIVLIFSSILLKQRVAFLGV